MNAIVTDAQSNHALSAVRSLGKKGIEVTAASDHERALSFYSKYSKYSLTYPSPLREGIESFVKFMLKQVQSKKYDAVIPIGPYETLALSLYKEEISPYIAVPVPNYDVFLKAWDKSQTFRIAMENVVPCPATFYPQSLEEVTEISKKVDYPVIIKPRITGGQGGIEYINSPIELVAKYKTMHDKPSIPLMLEYSYPLIQEYIPGEGCGFYALFWNSEPKAIFALRRIREYPLTGGPSSLRESISTPDVHELGIKVLKLLKWHGVAMVEFRRDSRDGKLKLIEVNPKFWGSLYLSIASGVDFPFLLYKLAIGQDVKLVTSYKTSLKARWLIPWDILWYIASLRSSTTNKLQITRDFFKFLDKNLVYDTVSLDDPKPAIIQLTQSYRSIIGSMAGPRARTAIKRLIYPKN
jgi:predicted ATP-grasp superfamily ATP-dependent carboligase